TPLGKLMSRFLDFGGRSRNQQHVGAKHREFFSDRLPNSLGSAGDDRPLSRQAPVILHEISPHSSDGAWFGVPCSCGAILPLRSSNLICAALDRRYIGSSFQKSSRRPAR